MRSLSVIILMLVSTTISAQAFNCGLFGIITDDYDNPYLGRFDAMMDSVTLESANTCELSLHPSRSLIFATVNIGQSYGSLLVMKALTISDTKSNTLQAHGTSRD